MNSDYYVDTSYGVSTSSGLTGAIAAMGLPASPPSRN